MKKVLWILLVVGNFLSGLSHGAEAGGDDEQFDRLVKSMTPTLTAMLDNPETNPEVVKSFRARAEFFSSKRQLSEIRLPIDLFASSLFHLRNDFERTNTQDSIHLSIDANTLYFELFVRDYLQLVEPKFDFSQDMKEIQKKALTQIKTILKLLFIGDMIDNNSFVAIKDKVEALAKALKIKLPMVSKDAKHRRSHSLPDGVKKTF